MSHRRNNIVLGGVGVRIRYKDEEVERTMVFHHIFVSVPRTFGDYCTSTIFWKRLQSSFALCSLTPVGGLIVRGGGWKIKQNM